MAKQSGRRKPSSKRTLQEVTSTLQDLVNNELSDASLRVKSLKSRVDQVREGGSATEPVPTPSNDLDETEDENWIEALGEELEEMMAEVAETSPTTGTTPPDSDKKKSGDQLDIWDDDIPVLRDVASPAKASKPKTASPKPQSTKELAHTLAIRSIARLNIELRGRGKPELEPLLVNRLQRILELELDQQAANVENSADE
jgi:hypothetical protein